MWPCSLASEVSPLSNHPRHRRTTSSPRGSFRCGHCRLDVSFDAPGTNHRNHCPSCLWSRHVDDDVPGDRDATCGASREPLAVAVRGDGEWCIVHRCRSCGQLRLNRTAGDDNPLLLVRLAVRPIALTPFPLEILGDL